MQSERRASNFSVRIAVVEQCQEKDHDRPKRALTRCGRVGLPLPLSGRVVMVSGTSRSNRADSSVVDIFVSSVVLFYKSGTEGA